jgi:hypothetical protein
MVTTVDNISWHLPVTAVDTIFWHLPVTAVDTIFWHLPVTAVDTILASASDSCGHYILASPSDSCGHCILASASENCGHCVLASARKHLDALLCTNTRTVSGISGSDSVFAEDSCLHWCGAVTLSECSPTFRPIFREYSTTQRRTQIRRESSSCYYKVTHFSYYCSPRILRKTCMYVCVCVCVCVYIYIYIYTHTHIHIQLLTITLASQPVKCQSQKHHLTLDGFVTWFHLTDGSETNCVSVVSVLISKLEPPDEAISSRDYIQFCTCVWVLIG